VCGERAINKIKELNEQGRLDEMTKRKLEVGSRVEGNPKVGI
jgi:hypothetical protein